MLSGLYIKLIASAIVISAVLGGYFYVRHLQNTVDGLRVENVHLETDKKALKETLDDVIKQKRNLEIVISAADKLKEENRQEFNNKNANVDKNVKEGKDRKVGPLLEDFFNE